MQVPGMTSILHSNKFSVHETLFYIFLAFLLLKSSRYLYIVTKHNFCIYLLLHRRQDKHLGHQDLQNLYPKSKNHSMRYLHLHFYTIYFLRIRNMLTHYRLASVYFLEIVKSSFQKILKSQNINNIYACKM